MSENPSSSILELLRQAERTDDPDVWNELGCTYAEHGKLSEAERCFRRAVELGESWVAFNLGNTLRDLGRF